MGPTRRQRDLTAGAASIRKSGLGDVTADATDLAGFALQAQRPRIPVVRFVQQRPGKARVEKELFTQNRSAWIAQVGVRRICKRPWQHCGRECFEPDADVITRLSTSAAGGARSGRTSATTAPH